MRFDGLHVHMSSSEAASTRGTSNAREERAALEGMLRSYPVEQLVEEVVQCLWPFALNHRAQYKAAFE